MNDLREDYKEMYLRLVRCTEYDRFAVHTESIISKDLPTGAFDVWYVFENGFLFLDDAVRAVTYINQTPDSFVYVYFYGMYYPVRMNEESEKLVICRDHAFRGNCEPVDLESCRDIQKLGEPSIGHIWTSGIFEDMLLVDTDIRIFDALGKELPIRENVNYAILLGMTAFSTMLCITNDEYVRTILKHYFAEEHMNVAMNVIHDLRVLGYRYYNPFSGVSDHTSQAYHRKLTEKKRHTWIPLDADRKPHLFTQADAVNGASGYRYKELHREANK